ncbi:MAG: HAMP domain-containing histidine kinase [Verrucomicrobia bacterium]|nr:HAMP domain-containing histidine kinase [Verrucomicrobiota bacterium]
MTTVVSLRTLVFRARRLPALVVGLALAILAVAIGLTTWQVRAGIRQQIARRDGEVLHAVVLREYESDVAQGLAGPISDVGSQLNAVLRSSQLKGVLGIRLFDARGRFVEAFPPYVREGTLDPPDLPALNRLRPVCHFRPHQPARTLFFAESESAVEGDRLPVLEVQVPLHASGDRRAAGIAQFLLEGHSIALEYRRLDRQLMGQALLVFAVGGGFLAAGMCWAFRRLRAAQRLLEERSENLLRANRELALAAKTSALGAVTAHLIHGLKNPLAGLQHFMKAHGTGTDEEAAADWEQAVALTRRMQGMINQIVTVLREDQTGVAYEISVRELLDLVRQQVDPMTHTAQVGLVVESGIDRDLPSRTAHLAALILANLAQNAIEASPRGGTVSITTPGPADPLTFEVRDEGPGFPEGQSPFVPCRSAKEGGCGIGLALSKQLANHLGAALELKTPAARGCVFVLRFPATRVAASRAGARAAISG